MPDLTIKHATVITMDRARRVLDDTSISISDGRITAIGRPAEQSGGEFIDGQGMVALPGLIDCHGHAGHTLLKSIGAGRPGQWQEAVHKIFRAGSSADFWYADAELLALERLKAGVTTGVSLLGGGDDMMRCNDPVYGRRHAEAIDRSGLRSFLAVGPGRPPFPIDYVRWLDDGPATQTVGFDEQIAVSEALIRECDGGADGRFRIATTMPVYKPWEIGTLLSMAEAEAMSARVRDLGERYGLRFTQDGHREGSLALAGELGLLGPASLMSHSVDLSEADFAAVVESDTRIVHNPYAVRSILGRCPVPELLDAGVTVVLGSDAAAPDRGYDMFRHIAQCMHYHRRHFRDPDLLPPGKMLEMVTIDAARALAMDDEIGSLEVGKRADLILLDMRKPHLYPPQMPVMRIAHYANASDVDTVIVDGRVLMRGRQALQVDEAQILDAAADEAARAVERSGLGHLLEEPDNIWRHSRWTNS